MNLASFHFHKTSSSSLRSFLSSALCCKAGGVGGHGSVWAGPNGPTIFMAA